MVSFNQPPDDPAKTAHEQIQKAVEQLEADGSWHVTMTAPSRGGPAVITHKENGEEGDNGMMQQFLMLALWATHASLSEIGVPDAVVKGLLTGAGTLAALLTVTDELGEADEDGS